MARLKESFVKKAQRERRTLRYYYWRAWLSDGSVVDQFTLQGDEHRTSQLTSHAPPIRMAWMPFCVARAAACIERGIAAVATVKNEGDEKPVAVLDSPDGRMILAATTGYATLFNRWHKDTWVTEEFYELGEYHLDHPLTTLTVHRCFAQPAPRIVTVSHTTPAVLGPTGAPLQLGNRTLDDEFEIKKKDL